MRVCLAVAILGCALRPAVAAEDPYIAAATVRTYVFAADGIASKCASAFPGIAQQVRTDLSKWKQDERVVIQRSEALWSEMQTAAPRPPNEEREDQLQLERLWISIIEQRPGDPPNQGRSRCMQYFSDRANGALRRLRPEVFRALETR